MCIACALHLHSKSEAESEAESEVGKLAVWHEAYAQAVAEVVIEDDAAAAMAAGTAATAAGAAAATASSATAAAVPATGPTKRTQPPAAMGAAGAPPPKRSTTIVLWGETFRVGLNGTDNGDGEFEPTAIAWLSNVRRLTGHVIVHVRVTCKKTRHDKVTRWWKTWAAEDPSKARARPLLGGGYSVWRLLRPRGVGDYPADCPAGRVARPN